MQGFNMAERFLRTKDIAELLGVEPGTVKKYRWQGKIPTETLLGVVGCRESTWNEWLNRVVKI